MKKFDFKSMVLGFVIAIIGVTAVLTVNAASYIRSASFSQARVYWLGQEVPLENPLVSVLVEGETNAKLYMPLRELLEFMNVFVEWDGENNSVNLTMRGNFGSGGNTSITTFENSIETPISQRYARELAASFMGSAKWHGNIERILQIDNREAYAFIFVNYDDDICYFIAIDANTGDVIRFQVREVENVGWDLWGLWSLFDVQ